MTESKMEKILALYQRYGIWIFLTGTLVFFLAMSFGDSVGRYVFLVLGAAAAISDPFVILVLSARQRVGARVERGLWISWALGFAALAFFLLRHFLEVPVEKLAAGGEALLPRLRLAFLFLFILCYGAALVYRLMMSLSFSVEALAAAVLREQKQSYLKGAAYSIFALVTVLVLVNYLASVRNPTLDLSPGYYSFSEDARTIMRSIDADVELYAFLPEQQAVRTRSDRQRQPELYRITDELRVMIEQLPVINPRVRLKFMNADLEAFNTREFGTVSNGTLIFRVLSKDVIDASVDKPYVERRVFVNSQRDMDKLEREVTQALLYVASPRRELYFTSANGERFNLTQTGTRAASVESLKEQLRFFNCTLHGLDTTGNWPGPIPENATALLILGPTVPFGPEARQAVLDYVRGGGKVFAAIDPEGREDFDWLLAELGGRRYRFNSSVLTNTNLSGVSVINNFGDHPVVEGIGSGAQPLVVYPLGGYFEPVAGVSEAKAGTDGEAQAGTDGEAQAGTDSEAAPGRTLTELMGKEFLHSPYNAFVDANRNSRREDNEPTARQILALAFEKPGSPEGAKVVIFSGVDWLAERGLSFPVANKNMTLASQTLFWMTESPLVAALAPKERQNRAIQITDSARFWLVLFAILFPVAIGSGLGVSIYLYRKNRRFVEAA